MKYLLLFILVIISYHSSAQTISGSIIDERNKPLEYVTVNIRKDTVLIGTSVSDSSGKYHFNNLHLNQRYELSYTFIGFKKKDTSILLTNNIDLLTKLYFDAKVLKEVAIKGTKKVIERKIDRLVFNVENNVNTIGSDALDILDKTPMVRVNNNSISLIGKETVGIMVNDKIIHLSGDALSAYLKTINAESITKIEVITNR